MKSNRELYQSTFSKLHASGQVPVLEGKCDRRRRLRKPMAACLAAVGILLAATTISFAMTGEGPVEFFKTFFRNADSPVAEEINGTYVPVTGQSADYGDMRIAFEGYSYTRDILLAKFRISPIRENLDQNQENQKPESKIDLKTTARQLRFMADVAGSASTDWESGEDGSAIASVRMGLDWKDREEDFTADILVWDREKGMNEPIAVFTVDQPSAMTRLVLEDMEIPHCKKLVLSSLNVKLYFDNTVSEREQNPVDTMFLNKEDGVSLSLYSKGDGEIDGIVSEVSFRWAEEDDSTMTIGFSRVLDLNDVRAVTINGVEYGLETQFHLEVDSK